MIYKRGAIYLANLNPSRGTEPGKTRPCLVIQSDLLSSTGHPSTTILPITYSHIFTIFIIPNLIKYYTIF